MKSRYYMLYGEFLTSRKIAWELKCAYVSAPLLESSIGAQGALSTAPRATLALRGVHQLPACPPSLLPGKGLALSWQLSSGRQPRENAPSAPSGPSADWQERGTLSDVGTLPVFAAE